MCPSLQPPPCTSHGALRLPGGLCKAGEGTGVTFPTHTPAPGPTLAKGSIHQGTRDSPVRPLVGPARRNSGLFLQDRYHLSPASSFPEREPAVLTQGCACPWAWMEAQSGGSRVSLGRL